MNLINLVQYLGHVHFDDELRDKMDHYMFFELTIDRLSLMHLTIMSFSPLLRHCSSS